MALSRRNKKLIDQVDSVIVPYKELSRPAQLSILTYVASGEYEGELRDLEKHLQKRKFGYAEIPTGILTDQIEQDAEIAEQCGDFEKYHDWYVTKAHIPDHATKNRWPVILSPFNDETLQDGWHRLHDYYRKGARRIPVIWFTKPKGI